MTQLKKEYNTLNQAFSLMMIKDNVYDLTDTALVQSIVCPSGLMASCPQDGFALELKKYLKINNTAALQCFDYTVKKLDLSEIKPAGFRAVSQTGAYYCFSFGGKSANYATEYYRKLYNVKMPKAFLGEGLLIDVNGKKKPNLYGRDIFHFMLGTDGKLYPEGSMNYSVLKSKRNTEHWKNKPSLCGVQGSKDLTGVKGDGCAARIMEENWQMNY